MSSTPRTVYINGRFLTQRITGIQRYARETLAELDALLDQGACLPSWRWVLLAPQGSSFPALRHIDARCVGVFAGHVWEQIDLARHSRDGLLVSFTPTGPLLKRAQLVTMHDASVYRVPEAFSWRFKLWYRLVGHWLAARSPRTLAVSEFAAAELVHWFNCDPRKISVTCEGWQHLERLQGDPRILERHALTPGRYVLAVSSPTANKNFQLVVRAASEVSHADIEFAIAGATDPNVFAKASVVPTGRVKMLGYVTDAELKALYEHALCLVFPSRYEGFGIPPLEAMSLGCPVMASHIAAVKEVCGSAAQYFDPDDHHEVARLVERLGSSPADVERMRSQGRSRSPQFSWREAARRTLSAVHQVAS